MNSEIIAQLMENWYRAWEAHILQHGASLDITQVSYARCVGVANPDRVRILTVPNIPLPHYPLLYSTFVEAKLITPDANGLTVGYGIFIKSDALGIRYWITHELAHVAQIEKHGRATILKQYFQELLTVGYNDSALEQEAHSAAMKCLSDDEEARREMPYLFFE